TSLSEEIDPRAVVVQGDDGLLPVGHPADAEAIAALLAQAVLGPDLLDADAKQILDRVLDLLLAGPGVDLERVGAVLARRLVRALLGDDGPHDDLVRLEFRPADAGLFLGGRHGRLLRWSHVVA